jgi:hypothetical protein
MPILVAGVEGEGLKQNLWQVDFFKLYVIHATSLSTVVPDIYIVRFISILTSYIASFNWSACILETL